MPAAALSFKLTTHGSSVGAAGQLRNSQGWCDRPDKDHCEGVGTAEHHVQCNVSCTLTDHSGPVSLGAASVYDVLREEQAVCPFPDAHVTAETAHRLVLELLVFQLGHFHCVSMKLVAPKA